MHLKSIRLTNFDPTKYNRNEELFTIDENQKANSEIVELRNALGFTDEEFLETLSGPDNNLVFTDELQSDAADLLKKYAD
jgi:Mg/Co/Ni transporter MgtE